MMKYFTKTGVIVFGFLGMIVAGVIAGITIVNANQKGPETATLVMHQKDGTTRELRIIMNRDEKSIQLIEPGVSSHKYFIQEFNEKAQRAVLEEVE